MCFGATKEGRYSCFELFGLRPPLGVLLQPAGFCITIHSDCDGLSIDKY